MPRVPTGFNPVQADTRLMSLRQDDTSREVGAVAGMQARQIDQNGQSLSAAGRAMMDEATRLQIEANRVQVVAAQNSAMQAKQALTFGEEGTMQGYLSFKGRQALTRPDKTPLTDEYAQKLRNVMADLEQNLGNDAQRKAFSVWGAGFETDFRGEVQRHVMGEFRQHEVSTYEGAQKLALNDAMAGWGDPGKVKNAIDGIPVPGNENQRYGGVRQSAYQFARAQGKSALETEYHVKSAVSAAHLGVITEALKHDKPAYAQSYMQAMKGDMLENDILRVMEPLQRHVDASMATNAVELTVKEFATKFQPTKFGELENVVRTMESGKFGDFGSDGKPLTSNKGAKYAMQVMPETAKNPGFGIRPAADDSPEEYNRVGREYLGALVKKYGNVGQALAAYNAGPGRLERAKQLATTDNVPESWLSYMPEETQKYVRNGMEKFRGGGGKPERPTESEFVQAAIKRLGPEATAEATRLTRSAAEHQYGIIVSSLKQRDDANVADAMRGLVANGGRMSALPPQMLADIPPKEIDNLYSFGQKIAKGDDITNPAIYNRLAADPEYLKKLTDDQFYRLKPELSEADFKHFAAERGRARAEKAASKPEEVNTTAINNILNDRLRSMGEDPTPKDGGDDAARIGMMRKVIRESVISAQMSSGKQMTDKDLENHIDGLFGRSVTFQNTFLGINTSKSSMRLLGMKHGDVPDDSREKIIADFKKKYGKEPSDAELLGIYWRYKNAGSTIDTTGAPGKW